jgi:uncharacterized protein (DUF427 family)
MTGHTITITPADVRVEVSIGGTKIAESDRPVLLEETGLPTRYYLPREDFHPEYLRPTDSETTCPFKGRASYWSVEVDGKLYADLLWSYEDPIPQADGVRGLVSFYNERVDLIVDGAVLTRPETPFSREA